MYKTLLLSLVLVSSAACLQAQAYPQSAQNHVNVQGCLQGLDGNYTLTADDGTIYQLTGNTAELKEHVGHEVQITGMTSVSGAESSARASSAGATPPASLAVKSVKHISKTCKSAAK
jgi:hypothetical protein